MSLIAELRRRNVFRVGVAYVIVAWLLIEVASVILPALRLPEWTLTLLVFLVAVGFPLALIFAWAFELTPEGIKPAKDVAPAESIRRLTGRKLDFAIIGLLAIAVVYFAVDKFVLQVEPEQVKGATEQVSPAESIAIEKSVAVLPFVDLSPTGDYEWFSDGLSEEILNSLAHLPELMVSARTSSFQFKGQDRAIGEIAQVLGVAHVVEGSVRRAGDQIRVTAQLIRASDSFHLWSEKYDRAVEDVFAVQEEIAQEIATALDVVLDEGKRDRMFRTGTRNVQAFEAYQRGSAIYDAAHALRADEDLFDANRWFERAIALDPAYSAAHLMHADFYIHFLMDDPDYPIAPRSQAPDLTEEAALERLSTDLRNAYQSARDPDIKLAMDYTRTVFSNSWHRLPALIRGLEGLYQTGKLIADENLWTEFRITLGDTEALLAEVNDRLRLSPLSILYWVYSTRTLIALGRHEEAIEQTRRARGIVGDHPLLTIDEGMAYALSGDLDAATRMFSTGLDSVSTRSLRALASVLAGNEKDARLRAQEIEAQFPRARSRLLVYGQLGDEEKLARLVREIDAKPLGPQELLLFMYGNRIFFSLDDTPNLRARLAEMGLDASHFQPVPRFTAIAEEADE
jgi:TolB-like protein